MCRTSGQLYLVLITASVLDPVIGGSKPYFLFLKWAPPPYREMLDHWASDPILLIGLFIHSPITFSALTALGTSQGLYWVNLSKKPLP